MLQAQALSVEVGGRLVVESKSAQGRKRVETWSRDGEESKLIVVTEMDLPSGGRFSVRRVYDAPRIDSPSNLR